MVLGDLLLLSGNDIPFPEARINIHQPTLKEIAYIGEEAFFIGCGVLDFSKDILDTKDKVNLSNYDDFDIFMTIINRKDASIKYSLDCAKLVLTLIFPLYQLEVRNEAIVLKKDEQEYYIDKNNFLQFKNIISTMFNLKMGQDEKEKYNPSGSMSKRIADKFKKRHEQLLQMAKEQTNGGKRISILSRYASILAVGTQKTWENLLQYTVYQLFDEFQRFQLKMQWDAYVQARMAGAKDLDEVDNWMIDLRDQGKNKNKNKNKK